jgi:hypothetical protein
MRRRSPAARTLLLAATGVLALASASNGQTITATRDLGRLPAYQRTETANSGVTFTTVACYRNVDLCKTYAKR